MNKKEKLHKTVFQSRSGIFEAVEIDRISGIISGYKLFPEYGVPNPYRHFKTVDCRIKELK